MPSPNSYLTVELALLLQQGLGSELAKLGQKTWLLRLREEATSIFKCPIPILPPPGEEKSLPACSGLSLGFARPPDGRVLYLWGATDWVVCAEITSRQTRSQRKVLSG